MKLFQVILIQVLLSFYARVDSGKFKQFFELSIGIISYDMSVKFLFDLISEIFLHPKLFKN